MIMKRLTLIAAALALSACAQYENLRGVDVTWEQAAVKGFEKGTTTRGEVLTALGPPSQVISLEDETVLYYLYERGQGTGLILIVYNQFKLDTRYDRAVFFFDENDRLTDYATQIQPGS